MLSRKNLQMVEGFIKRDPKIQEFGKGKKLAMFTIAVTSSWYSSEKGVQKRTNYIKAKCWDKFADHAEKLHDGDYVAITGTCESGSYEKKDGTKVYEQYLSPFEITNLTHMIRKFDGREEENNQNNDTSFGEGAFGKDTPAFGEDAPAEKENNNPMGDEYEGMF